MPYDGTKGVSRWTRHKQECYGYVLDLLVNAVAGISARTGAPSLWVELHAGDGRYVDPELGMRLPGSPLILLTKLQEAAHRWHSFNPSAILIEIDEQAAASLGTEASRFHDLDVQVVRGDCADWLRTFTAPKNVMGLIYSDPNGSRPPSEAISSFYDRNRAESLDCLLNVSCARIKGARCCPSTNDERYLADHISTIRKRRAYARPPYDRHQWSHVLLTNWVRDLDLTSRGFYDVTTEEGQEIFMRLNLTNAESSAVRQEQSPQLSLWS